MRAMLSWLLILGLSVQVIRVSAKTAEAIPSDESTSQTKAKYRPLEAASNSDIENVQVPTGIARDQLTFRKVSIGADSSPPLIVAIKTDNQRLWIDSARDGKLVELAAVQPNNQRGDTGNPAKAKSSVPVVPDRTAEIQAQPSIVSTELWPSPSTIPVVFHFDDRLKIWLVATRALLRDSIDLQGQAAQVLVHDRNSDGRFEGQEDLVQIDLNGDGHFDPIRESFPFGQYWRYKGQRFAIGWDLEQRRAKPVSLHELGSLTVDLAVSNSFEQPPESFKVTLVSDGGVHVSLRSTEPCQVPPGIYHLHTAVIEWHGETQWRMAFSKFDAKSGKSFRVEPNKVTEVEILGTCELTMDILNRQRLENTHRLQIQPYLKSETGLYLTRSSSGKVEPTIDGTLIASIRAPAAKGQSESKTLATASTQFACGQFCPLDLQWKGDQPVGVHLAFDTGPLRGPSENSFKLQEEPK